MDGRPQRREAKQFEPPPWEREQFEEIARRREEQQADVELAEAIAAASRTEPEPLPSETPAVAESQAPQSGRDPSAEAALSPDAEEAELDEAAVAAMLSQLRAEEPEVEAPLWRVGVASSGLAAVIGSVLVVWGVAAILRARTDGPASMIGGTILVVFGGMFVGVGMWMAVRSLKQRGVL